MSRDVILSLLRQGSNGEQILQILDSIANGVSDSGGSDSAAAPTLSEILIANPCAGQTTGTGFPLGGSGDPILREPKQTNQMTRLDVICPAAPWENTTTDADRAWDLCLDLSEEYGYAQVRQNGVIIGDYTDGR
jgi:hypothetical protein